MRGQQWMCFAVYFLHCFSAIAVQMPLSDVIVKLITVSSHSNVTFKLITVSSHGNMTFKCDVQVLITIGSHIDVIFT